MQTTMVQEGRIPCTVNVAKTVQEEEYEPFVVELQETRWVKDEDYDKTHLEIFNRLAKRIDQIFKERYV